MMSAKLKEIVSIPCVVAKEVESTTNVLAKMPFEKGEDEKLYTYIKYAHAPRFGEFVLSRSSCEWSLERERDSENIATMKNIPTTNCIYRLCYAREPDTQQFTAKLKGDCDPYGVLTHPPIMLKEFSACEMNNIIYVHNSINDYFGYSDQSAGSDFSAEEVRRGIYAYHCQIDRWRPVPALETRVRHAILTTDQDRVYALGSHTSKENTLECQFQAYDERTSAWQTLAAPTHFYSSRFSDAIFFKDRLFALNTDFNLFEIYDVKAKKWTRHPCNLTPKYRHPCFCCPEKVSWIEPVNREKYEEYESSIEGNQCPLADRHPSFKGENKINKEKWNTLFQRNPKVSTFSYGKCRFVQFNDHLYLFSIGAQENLIWVFNEKTGTFSPIMSLNHDLALHPKMKNCSQIYDVVAF